MLHQSAQAATQDQVQHANMKAADAASMAGIGWRKHHLREILIRLSKHLNLFISSLITNCILL